MKLYSETTTEISDMPAHRRRRITRWARLLLMFLIPLVAAALFLSPATGPAIARADGQCTTDSSGLTTCTQNTPVESQSTLITYSSCIPLQGEAPPASLIRSWTARSRPVC